MHSGLCEQYVKSLGLLASGFDLLFRTYPRASWQKNSRTGLNPITMPCVGKHLYHYIDTKTLILHLVLKKSSQLEKNITNLSCSPLPGIAFQYTLHFHIDRLLRITRLKIFKETMMIFLRCAHRVNFIIFANILKQLCRAFYQIIV